MVPLIRSVQQFQNKPLKLDGFSCLVGQSIDQVWGSTTKLTCMHETQPTKKFELHDEKGKKTGYICIDQFNIVFLDYIQAGLDMSSIIAIDATASNGDPKLTTSLHYVDYFLIVA